MILPKLECLSRRVHQKRCTLHCAGSSQLKEQLRADLQHSMELASEKDASNWLSALPLEKYSFAPHKGAFQDAVTFIMAGYQNIFLLIVSVYKVSLLIILSCPTGGFPIVRHNELRDVTVNLLQEVCHDVCSEPHLQQLSGEVLNGRTSIRGDDARLDVSACGYWGCRLERAFLCQGI